jgi:2-polyprenyl-3-methyl-5-hydroxy-6-metoxy-1,4-benzoquinol methylase
MGSNGNDWHKLLIKPATIRLLDISRGERVLDIGCGNGNFSRTVAALDVDVVAVDISEEMIACAKERTRGHRSEERITYRVLDASDESSLLKLGKKSFDAALSNMVLMDMAEISPLFKALAKLLKEEVGRFVFSIMHPCFQTSGWEKVAYQYAREDGRIESAHALQISEYIKPSTILGEGILGQPTPTRYHHRPLSLLLNTCFEEGFVVDGLEEPVFPESAMAKTAFSWENMMEIPPVVVIRVSLAR